MNDYILPVKAELTQIKVDDIRKELPDLKNSFESKSVTIAKWLMEWIEEGFKNNTVDEKTLLPSKGDMAYMFGVSIGTIQNSLRYIEDNGYVESKQCIGTVLRNPATPVKKMRKLTSKREIAINEIKKFIIENNIKIGEFLPSSRVLAGIINNSTNTTRLALEHLSNMKILEHKYKNPNENGWILVTKDFDFIQDLSDNENETLVQKVEADLKNYITENLQIGDRIPPHSELSKTLKVSIKTIHDAFKALIDEGILLARRGRYGTTVLKMPYDKNVNQKKETSIFASAPETAFYYYERTQDYIKKMISENYQVGEKLPSIMELSKQLDLSPNTIRKAFQNLAKEGYLAFSRGRYGGTFIIDIPNPQEQAFKWLAVNPQYAKAYNKELATEN